MTEQLDPEIVISQAIAKHHHSPHHLDTADEVVQALSSAGYAITPSEGVSMKANPSTAAPILASMFTASVLAARTASPPRLFLYIWEREALAWLKAWRETDADTPICSWASNYMRHGPPPWRE